MKPNTRLSKDDCDPNPKQDFHRCYRGIVGSLGYLVTMTRPDLAFSYSKLSKYVQFLASHTWRRLNTFYDISVTLGMSPSLTPVALENQMSCRDGWTQIGPATLILAAHTPVTSS